MQSMSGCLLSTVVAATKSSSTMLPVRSTGFPREAMGFTLSEASGKVISNAEARGASYAGSDVAGMALTLVNEEADLVVARLYADYCTNAGIDPPPKSRPARK